MSRYSYTWQYAESAIDKYDDKGPASSEAVLQAFDEFDWAAQVGQANQLQRCSPTLTVRDSEADRELWVSAAGEPSDFEFVNQYTYVGETRRLFGLLRGTGPVCPPGRMLSQNEARTAISLFVSGDHEAILKLIA